MGQEQSNTKSRECKQLNERERHQIEILLRGKRKPTEISK